MNRTDRMMPQVVTILERETGSLISRVSFSADQETAIDFALSNARRRAKSRTYRLWSIKPATLSEIERHFTELHSRDVISLNEMIAHINHWDARLANQ